MLVPSVSPAPQSAHGDITRLSEALSRHRIAVITTTVLLTFLAAIVTLLLPVRYTAESLVMIEGRRPNVVNVEAVLTTLPGDAETIQSEVKVLQSRNLARRVVLRLGLIDDPEFNLPEPPSGLYSELRSRAAALYDRFLGDYVGLRRIAAAIDPENRTIDRFLSRLRVRPEPRSRVIGVSYTASSPEKAALIANAIAELYITGQLEAKYEATERANKYLSERLSDLKERVRLAEDAVEKFRSQASLTRGRDATPAAQQVSELNSQLTIARANRAETEARLREAERLAAMRNVDRLNSVLGSPVIQNLRAQETEVARSVAEISQSLGERHPRMQRALAEQREVQQGIQAEINRVLATMRNDLAVAVARETSLSKTVEEFRGYVARDDSSEVQLRALEREASANRTLLETFLNRSKETTENGTLVTADAQVISRADPPETPSFPQPLLFIAVSFLGAALVGVVVALVLEHADHGFRSMEQIEPHLGVPALALVPRWNGISRTPENEVTNHPLGAFAESLRSVYAAVAFSSIDKPPRVLLIASSLPGEGKTTLTLSLGRLLARSGKRVLVIDADLRRPTAHTRIGTISIPGLTDYLAASVPREFAIQRDPQSPLDFLASGTRVPNPAEILGSEQMQTLLREVAREYDLVLLDSPPVLAVADSHLIARYVDRTVYVVHWAKTRRDTAALGLRKIREAGAAIAGVVITMVNPRKHARYRFGDSGLYYGRVKKYYVR
jgi:capsular exopolysaccharide synthesis family protein